MPSREAGAKPIRDIIGSGVKEEFVGSPLEFFPDRVETLQTPPRVVLSVLDVADNGVRGDIESPSLLRGFVQGMCVGGEEPSEPKRVLAEAVVRVGPQGVDLSYQA